MSSEVDICNLALSHLGDEAEVSAIDPPDGSPQSNQCGRFYPIARDVLLEAHAWTFATKRVALAEVTNPSPDDWTYAYALPSTCLRPLSSLYPGIPARALSQDTDNDSHPYIIEADQDGSLIMFTNVETAVLRYIDRVEDPTKFTPGFTITASRLLAAYLAGPILKGKEGRAEAQNQMRLFGVEYAKATAVNANTGRRNTYQTRTPAHLAARGGLTPAFFDRTE
jgi:hypothetical protein